MKPEEFKAISEGIKALVISIGVMVGGAWAYYSFDATLQRENAEAALSKLKHDLERRPIINSEISAISYGQDSKGYLILVKVSLVNIGRFPVEIEIPNTPEEAPVKVVRITTNDDGNLVNTEDGYRAILKSVDHIPDTVYLLPGRVERQEYLLQVPEPGVYLVQFKVPAPVASIDYAKEVSLESMRVEANIWIEAVTYLTVAAKEKTRGTSIAD